MGRIDIGQTEGARFTRSAAGQPLEFDHTSDVASQKEQGGVDDGILDRTDGLRFPGRRPSPLKPDDGGEPTVDGFVDEFFARRPFEHSPDEVRPAVALGPGKATVDPPLPDRLELQGPEFGGREVGVLLSERTGHQFALGEFARRPAIWLAVVPFGVFEEGEHKFC
ncbi:hypothetical protein [Limnoglobus roseus]|uniref:hypothetical protein n=1 Tax=Limnoglobus roseus TaxID=2598579 RepID=UPI001FEC8950|nr:hypothetical protein [Limnoglobus roseus]